MNIPQAHNIQERADPKPTTSLYRYVWVMSGRHQLGLSVLAIFSAALSMAPIDLQKRIVNEGITAKSFEMTLYLGGIYAVIVLVQSALNFALRYYSGWISESAIKNSRRALLHVEAHEKKERIEADKGNFVSVIGNEVQRLGSFVGDAISDPLVNGGKILAILGYMLFTEFTLAMSVLVALIPVIVLVPWLQKLANSFTERNVIYLRRLLSFVSDSENVMAASTQDVNSAGKILNAIYRAKMGFNFYKYVSKSVINISNNAAPVIALVVGGLFVINGKTSLGVVLAFITGFDRLSDPLNQCLNFYQLASQVRVRQRLMVEWILSRL